MKNLVSHIDFLISKHNCVIVPNFGGFVVNKEPASIDNEGKMTAPTISFAFNKELKYNDGLLAECYMNENGTTYEEACNEIECATKRLATALNMEQSVQIGKVGTLFIDEGKNLTFEPNTNIALHPLIFGYSNLTLQPLDKISEIKHLVAEKKKRFEIRQVITGMTAAAAAILIFFISSTPIIENNTSNLQKAGFLSEVLAPSNNRISVVDSAAIASNKTEAIEDIAILDNSSISKEREEVKKPEAKITVKKSAELFHIIIASEASKNSSDKRLSIIKNEGFSSAKVLASPKRMRISIAAFGTKTEAEKYLQAFRVKYPKFKDAWVLSTES